MKVKLTLPTIADDEKTPIVEQLLVFIEQQAEIIEQQAEQIQQLKDEIARLKNHPRKPDIKPSSLEKKKKDKSKRSKGKRPGSKKRRKTKKLQIHNNRTIEPEHIPDGSEFRYYKTFVVQDIKLQSFNTRFRLKVYKTPAGKCVAGQLPAYLNGGHFGPTLIRFALYQYYHCHVTQPLLLEQLRELAIDISAGKLNNILIENKERFHKEKDDILAVGLQVSNYINVDDTGARHNGKNGYCTHIGNEFFSWFESTNSKSRINFLKLLRAGHSDYILNMDAIAYMQSEKLSKYVIEKIGEKLSATFANDQQWQQFLTDQGIAQDRHVKIATEGALFGSIIEHGICNNLVIVSDDAGQFNVFLHALCWIHANRAIDKIVPFTDQAKKDLDSVKDQVWLLYNGLKSYKQNPNKKDKKCLEKMFDEIFSSKTASATLNQALKRIYQNKSELLLVLQRPDIPLHNNGAESAIREYVKKRKISGSTRSETGRQCRDTFTSLKKTCRKLGLSFWQYLKDRIEKTGSIPDLSELIPRHELKPG